MPTLLWYRLPHFKKKLKHVSNQKHKEPYNKITKLNYHHMNKEYKHLLKQKKWKHQNYKMEELVNSSNPRKFWLTLKKLSTKSANSQDLSVLVGKLYTRFQNLHSKPHSGQYSEIHRNTLKVLDEQDTSLLQSDTLDKPITESEVRKVVKLLKNEKAAGFDKIWNEMLKSGISHSTAPKLVKLFIFIISNVPFLI